MSDLRIVENRDKDTTTIIFDTFGIKAVLPTVDFGIIAYIHMHDAVSIMELVMCYQVQFGDEQ
jgi:hypothetical protein